MSKDKTLMSYTELKKIAQSKKLLLSKDSMDALHSLDLDKEDILKILEEACERTNKKRRKTFRR